MQTGTVVRYEFPTVAQCVLDAREPDARIAQVCWDNDITPRILRHWCQQYSRSSTECLKRLLAVYSNRGGGEEENVLVGSSSYLA